MWLANAVGVLGAGGEQEAGANSWMAVGERTVRKVSGERDWKPERNSRAVWVSFEEDIVVVAVAVLVIDYRIRNEREGEGEIYIITTAGV